MSLYLGTDLISGATKITLETFVDAFYPVGSVFIGTTATCPLASIKGTWTLQGSGIVTSVDSNVPCKGDGKTLGLTDGTNTGGLACGGGTGYVKLMAQYQKNLYNATVGTTSSGTTNQFNNVSVGITTDETKSGIVGTVTSSSYTVNIWERTA